MEPLLIAILGYLGVLVALPVGIAMLVHGHWPVAFQRDANPFQRLMGIAFGALLVGWVVYAVLVPILGAPRMGIWEIPGAATTAGWVLFAVGALLTLVGQFTMGASWRMGIDDRETALVVRGVFRAVRNPIFTGLVATLAGAALISPSPWTVMGLAGSTLLIMLQARLEEQHLLALHGPVYGRYASEAGRFLPGIGRLVRPPRGEDR
ncbi:MAG: isoprenylcysteine carboxylmethyltransferase family protein [Myxococcota bacterium]|jgi:protein-S-isoprenylcysteine O-methyltransferase Ste14|nr:isoprenylcysteine carboxylmethyltransferase family protein [Myxococcota bacterium]